MAERENREAVAFLVPAPARQARAVRVNITLPEDVLADVDRVAGRQGLSQSSNIVDFENHVRPYSSKTSTDPEETAVPWRIFPSAVRTRTVPPTAASARACAVALTANPRPTKVTRT